MTRDEVSKYLTAIEIPEIQHQRVFQVINFYESMVTSKPLSFVFISQIQDGTGQILPQNLNLFFGDVWCEAKNLFSNVDDFDLIKIRPITSLMFKKLNYELEPANSNSYFQVEAIWGVALRSTLNAYGSNCDVLLELTQKVLIGHSII